MFGSSCLTKTGYPLTPFSSIHLNQSFVCGRHFKMLSPAFLTHKKLSGF